MSRFERGTRVVATACGAWAILLGLLAMPASATVSCPTPKSSNCVNVLPIAITTDATNGEQPATDLESSTAVLNGVVGPGVSNGPATEYYFQYGTSTAYGTTTPTGTIGSCPPGVPGGSPYCAVPPAEYVHFTLSSLVPCTTYHFRVVATNLDGGSVGSDRTFATEFSSPFQSVQVRKRVKHRHSFSVSVRLVTPADIKIQLRFHGKTVKTYDMGLRSGQFSKRIRAPKRKGQYTIKVIARESCGQQTKTRYVRVT